MPSQGEIMGKLTSLIMLSLYLIGYAPVAASAKSDEEAARRAAEQQRQEQAQQRAAERRAQQQRDAKQQKLDEQHAKRRMDAHRRGENPYSAGVYNNDPGIQRQKLLERQAELKRQEQERERRAKERFDRDMRRAQQQP
jgi:hypothetical protein